MTLRDWMKNKRKHVALEPIGHLQVLFVPVNFKPYVMPPVHGFGDMSLSNEVLADWMGGMVSV